MANTVTTWADGYGRWHAETAVSRLALTRCIEAMADEIFERSPRGTQRADIVSYVNQGIVSAQPSASGLVHMVEYAI